MKNMKLDMWSRVFDSKQLKTKFFKKPTKNPKRFVDVSEQIHSFDFAVSKLTSPLIKTLKKRIFFYKQEVHRPYMGIS